jgi:hypothetical protein
MDKPEETKPTEVKKEEKPKEKKVFKCSQCDKPSTRKMLGIPFCDDHPQGGGSMMKRIASNVKREG